MKNKKWLILLFIIGFASIYSILFSSSKIKVYLISSEHGILISDNNGKTWFNFNKGLPDKCELLRFYAFGNELYLSTFSSGLFRLNKDEWKNISSPLFKRKSIYDKNPGYRKISAFAADPDDPRILVAATKHSIYKSEDSGTTWVEIPTSGFNKRNYFTALAVSGGTIYAGTSFNGIYELKNNAFIQICNGLPGEQYSDTLKFTEQISSLAINNKKIYAGFYFGGGLYYKDLNGKKFNPLFKTEKPELNSIIFDIKFSAEKVLFSDRTRIYHCSNKSDIVGYSGYNEIIERMRSKSDASSGAIIDETGSIPPLSIKINNPDKKTVTPGVFNKKAIYISIPVLKKNLDHLIKKARETGINSFVIDMKDDFGNIYFQARTGTAKEINSQKKPVEISAIIKKLKENGIYSIARIVTFKDQKMYNAYNGKYAVKNRQTGKPWKGTESEYWVDPFSEFVQNYNIELACDLEFLGFDEIQFDYIRFPSDGHVNLCEYSYKNNSDTYKSEILIDFLKKAKQCLNIPVSVDIYGFNSWYFFGNWIGQDMEELSYVVDAICPMVYPSHFGNRFYAGIEKRMRPYRIVLDGGIRSIQMINRNACIRPYLQAFNLLSPTWGPEYINLQIRAAKEGGCSGYILWNANGDYSVPYSALKDKGKK